MSNYLYEAGMTGTRQVSYIEKEYKQKLDELFKPRGQNPSLNKGINDLQEKKKALLQWEAYFSEYDKLQEEHKSLQEEVQLLQKKKEKTAREIERTKRLLALETLVEEMDHLEKRGQELKEYSLFSVSAEKELERLQRAEKELSESIETETYKMTELEEDISSIKINETVLKNQLHFYALKDRLGVHERQKEEIAGIKKEAEKEKEEILSLARDAGWKSERPEDVFYPDTSVAAEQELVTITEAVRQALDRERFFQEQLSLQEEKVRLAEEEATEANRRLLSYEERANVQEKVQAKREDKNTSSSVFAVSLFIISFVFLGSWQVFTASPFLGVLFFALALAGYLWLVRTQGANKNGTQGSVNYDNSMDARRRIEDDDFLKRQLEQLQWKKEKEEKTFQELHEKKEEFSRTRLQKETEFVYWKEEYGFPDYLNIRLAEKLFYRIKELQNKSRSLAQKKEDIGQLEKSLNQYEKEVLQLADTFSVSSVKETRMLIYQMEKAIDLEKEKATEKSDKEKEWMNLQKEMKKKKENMYQIKDSINSILFSFHVNTVEEYYNAMTKKREHDRLTERYELILGQMKPYMDEGETIEELKAEIRAMDEPSSVLLGEKEQKIEYYQAREKEIQEKKAEKKQRLTSIEKGGTYEEQLQRYKEDTISVNELAKEWAVYKTALVMIKKAKAVHEKERQPQVMKQAARYFADLTEGEYVNLFAPLGEQRFVAENKLGLRFSPEELSRGTAEQLYLALRLALAEIHDPALSFPLIMDDPFVNFDDQRRKRAFALLSQLSQTRQIIYFSCHSHSKEEINPAKVNHLSEEYGESV